MYTSSRIRFLALAIVGANVASCTTLGDQDKLARDDFALFESWHRVNAEPLVGAGDGLLQGKHLEDRGLREVNVNELGRPVFEGTSELPFPVGTIVVKDTFYVEPDGGKGRRWNITVMKKREPGYDPGNGDWEWATVGPTKNIRIRGKWRLCIDCHAVAAAKDYVFTWE